jgi:transcription elongation GreA/GreB family factor
MDKAKLLQAAIGQVEAKLQELRAGYEASRDAVLSTPHVMKSKREVFGQESAYLANALALSIQEREQELRALQSLRLPAQPARAALGCLVGVTGTAGATRVYFILPVCGGMELTSEPEGCAVRVITPGTPVARALLGKSPGDEVTLPTTPRTYALLSTLE